MDFPTPTILPFDVVSLLTVFEAKDSDKNTAFGIKLNCLKVDIFSFWCKRFESKDSVNDQEESWELYC